MATEISDDVRAFLQQPNPAVMATLAKDGRPVAVATWYLLEPSGEVLLNLDAERGRLGHLRRDPRVALDVLEDGNWYRHVSLQLRVVRIEDDEGHADIDRLSRHYGGRPYPDHVRPRVSVRCEVLAVHAWG